MKQIHQNECSFVRAAQLYGLAFRVQLVHLVLQLIVVVILSIWLPPRYIVSGIFVLSVTITAALRFFEGVAEKQAVREVEHAKFLEEIRREAAELAAERRVTDPCPPPTTDSHDNDNFCGE